MESEWTSVKDSYPPKEDEYKDFLVTYATGKIGVERLLFTIKQGTPYFSGGYEVKAWMPSPAPYTEENDYDYIQRSR